MSKRPVPPPTPTPRPVGYGEKIISDNSLIRQIRNLFSRKSKQYKNMIETCFEQDPTPPLPVELPDIPTDSPTGTAGSQNPDALL